jgi:hypothetical protein
LQIREIILTSAIVTNALCYLAGDLPMADTGEMINVICFAEGTGERWEAFCLNYDLAVQGSSNEDAMRKLKDQILLYVEEVRTLPEPDRRRLLNRKAPLSSWLRALVDTVSLALHRGTGTLPREFTVNRFALPM